jgi:quinol-cytochrome oxidoreductase complex cytochrome b subunit
MSIAEAFMIYGLIIVGYGILAIQITKTWSGDWRVDRYLPWLTLDMFMMVSFGLSFFGFIIWRYLKYTEVR